MPDNPALQEIMVATLVKASEATYSDILPVQSNNVPFDFAFTDETLVGIALAALTSP